MIWCYLMSIPSLLIWQTCMEFEHRPMRITSHVMTTLERRRVVLMNPLQPIKAYLVLTNVGFCFCSVHHCAHAIMSLVVENMSARHTLHIQHSNSFVHSCTSTDSLPQAVSQAHSSVAAADMFWDAVPGVAVVG